MCTCLYADDAVVFMAPIKRDIESLSGILQCLGDVMGLVSSFLKSPVVPIQCNHIKIGGVP